MWGLVQDGSITKIINKPKAMVLAMFVIQKISFRLDGLKKKDKLLEFMK